MWGNMLIGPVDKYNTLAFVRWVKNFRPKFSTHAGGAEVDVELIICV